MKSVSALLDNLQATQFEEEEFAAQEDMTEWAIKKARRDYLREFHWKGNEEQLIFNADTRDRIKAVAKKVKKIKM